ncbi:zinc ribbon domain-containing protein [Dehalococcoides mccartyi]|uniref:Zinc ribbon domain-containing protein n=1 Tax=Dehalococcoides mccartyi TaxID=61435 RepID=A0A2J1E0A9_9CHLR|nr:zinc ribbon domain-containing protein [Dehalococcoides mccartyi]
MWFSIGMIVGALIVGLVWWLKAKNAYLKWYEWLIGIAGAALLVFTIQNIFGSFAETEPKAAAMFVLVTGLPSLILLAIAWQLALRRFRTVH